MRRIMLVVVVLALGVVLSGCVTWSGGIASATKPLAVYDYTVLGKQSGTSWGVTILGIPFCQASTAEALDEALKYGAADALIQVTVDNRWIWIVVGDLWRIKVEGLAVKEPVKTRK